MNFVKYFLVFSLSMFLLSCSNNVEELNKRLVELSQLSIDECWNELVKPIEIEPNKIDELVEMDYLKYRVGMITLESFSQLTSRIVQKESIHIPYISNLPNQPDLKRLTEYREANKRQFTYIARSSEIEDDNPEISSACQCMEVMARPDEHPKLKVLRCKRMYICWDNAQADCLSGTVNVYKKCEF